MPDFPPLKRSIEKLLGIQCSNYKEDYIRRRVGSRMRLNGIEKYPDYSTYLLKNKTEQEALRNALTINVTKFWRDTEVFDLIKKEVIPEVIRRKNRIRIWSAGCATGEEPYTLAIIVYDLTRMKSDVQVTIFASDLDNEALNKARAGVYDKKALENLTESQIRRHFTLLDNEKYQVKPHLKKMIKFSKHDLMSGKPVTNYLDIVLCRNVTIYFTEEQKNKLAKIFQSALLMDGYYIMGKTEYMGREVEDLYTPYNSIQKIYKKKM